MVQFGGGISTSVALPKWFQTTSRSRKEIPRCSARSATDKGLRDFTNDVTCAISKVRVIDYDGRLCISPTPSNRYDIIDLSLADSAGLSSPGGFAIVEKFSYTREAMLNYMRALKDGGMSLRHALEQGRAAEIGPQALCHHGGGGT